MRKLIVCCLMGLFIYSCSSNNGEKKTVANSANETGATANDASGYDPHRGEGKFDQVEIGEHLDAPMAAAGKMIVDLKCASCHKLTDEKLVGPGWKGVTQRRKPQWIMNFITNPDPMIDKDPELQAQLELCMVRMPNQNLTDEEARKVLEFMRQNDGVK
ncbi:MULTISPECIES: c-type cytochrome [unclassified Sphingobacterium]|uniref:c-type cytochrome n=1 Tax=unclassified Sphingobacterium TaxID=2609468 RepID=UPI0025E5537A|nr:MULTISPECIES: cytochrome c [unclassified Sphingobacterium]MDR6735020.1 mono/diheme cytochrome c family protein [Sphingobacterium sp. 2149]